MTSDKIRPEHLSRRAFVYVRQSSLGQVRQHRESGQRHHLAQHARTLGWADVVVVDDDQGKSGSMAGGRPGFQRLVAEVSLGRVGPCSAWRSRGWPGTIATGISSSTCVPS